LDADSDGAEGKYYTFTMEELKEALGDEAALGSRYFNATAAGNWEEESTNVLYVNADSIRLLQETGMTDVQASETLESIKKRLYIHREQRNRPSRDDKVICAWNAMMLKALTDA